MNKVERIALSDDFAKRQNQKISYITERAVFRLGAEGVILTKVAPGIDIEPQS